MKSLLKNGLVMVIYNWKGLKEGNYLYTLSEFKQRNTELAEAMEEFPEKWIDDAFSADKTYIAKKVASEDELFQFLHGKFNDLEQEEKNIDWYWENRCGDLFDKEPFTCVMKTCLLEMAARTRCGDCACLIETDDGNWGCDCSGKDCRDVWKCPESENDEDLLDWMKK